MAKQSKIRCNLTNSEYARCIIARHGISLIEQVNSNGLLALIERTYPKLDKDQVSEIRLSVRAEIPEKGARKSLLNLYGVTLQGKEKPKIDLSDLQMLDEQEDTAQGLLATQEQSAAGLIQLEAKIDQQEDREQEDEEVEFDQLVIL